MLAQCTFAIARASWPSCTPPLCTNCCIGCAAFAAWLWCVAGQEEFKDPITYETMTDPVVLCATGQVYDYQVRPSIDRRQHLLPPPRLAACQYELVWGMSCSSSCALLCAAKQGKGQQYATSARSVACAALAFCSFASQLAVECAHLYHVFVEACVVALSAGLPFVRRAPCRGVCSHCAVG